MIRPEIDNTPIVELVKNLKEMKAALDGATDPKRIEEINADIAQTNKLIKEQAGAYDASGKSIKEVRTEFVAFRNALGEADSEEDMLLFAKAAGIARDRMADLNERVAVFSAGSKFEQASIGLSQIGADLGNLDFEGAAEKADNLAKLVSTITFAEATKGLGQLGSTFLNLGKALLTNPLFLIPAAITAILAATGLLGPALDGIKAIFSALGDVVEEFLKYLGLSTKETERLAAQKKKLKEESDKQTESVRKESTAFVTLISKLKATNEGSKERSELIKEINKEYGTSLKNIQDETLFQGQLNLAVEDYIKQKYREYNLKANEEKLVELFEKKGKATKEFNKQLKALTSGYTLVDKAAGTYKSDFDGTIITLGELRSKGQIFNKVMLDQEKILNDVDEQILNIGKSSLKYADAQTNLGNKTKKTTESIKDLTDTIIEEERKLSSFQAQTLEEQNALKQKQLVEDTQRRIKDLQDSNATEIQKAEAIKLINQNMLIELDRLDAEYYQKLKEREEEALKNTTKARRDYVENLIEETNQRIPEIDVNIEPPTIEDIALEDFDGKLSKMEQMFLKFRAKVETEGKNLTGEIARVASEALNITANLTQSIGGMLMAFDNQRIADAEGNEEEQEKIRKKSFERDKKFRIAGVIIDTAAAIAKSVAASPTTGGLPFSAVAATTGAIQVATISAQKYNSAGRFPNSTPDRSSTPNFNLFGQSNQANTVNASPQTNSQQMPQQMMVKAVVVESDVTNTINKVARYRNLAEL